MLLIARRASSNADRDAGLDAGDELASLGAGEPEIFTTPREKSRNKRDI
jgi:hypothetical protein